MSLHSIFIDNLCKILKSADKAFNFPAEECFTEENIQYWSTNAETLTTDAGIKYVDSITECKEYCETTFPEEAKFFTYNSENAELKGRWKKSCRCKKNQNGRQQKDGVTSGNLWCCQGDSHIIYQIMVDRLQIPQD